jgi:quercetin dioxygenase-like cupin family protein
MRSTDAHRQMHEKFNQRDLDGITERLADDFRYVDRARRVTMDDAQAFRSWLNEWVTGMSNAAVRDSRYVDAGDTSIALFTGSGRHDGQLGPFPPSGNDLAMAMCELLTFDEEGRVTGGEMYYDLATVEMQARRKLDTVARTDDNTQAFWMLGGLYEVLVSSEESGGAMTTMRMTLPAGMGPPPHTHPGIECVYVVSGAIRYHIEDKTIDGRAGSSFLVPAETLEWFEPTEMTQVVVNYLPGGIDQFFAAAGEPARSLTVPPPPTSPPDVDRLTAIGAQYGLRIEQPRVTMTT